jgi:hypothetical protein
MPKLRLELVDTFMLVDTDRITPRDIDNMGSALSDANYKLSFFGKHPMADGESEEDWKKRCDAEIEEKNKKQEGETETDYVRRMLKIEATKPEVLFETLVAIAKVFGQEEKFTRERFNVTPYGAMKNFTRDVLKAGGFPDLAKDYE